MRPAIPENEQKTFEKFVADRPLATYDDLAAEWSKKTGKKISRSAIVGHVLRLGFTRKKLTKEASEKSTKKNTAKRAAYKSRIKAIDPRTLVFLDESSFRSNQTPNYGRATCGVPAYLTTPAGRSKTFTQVGAIRMDGRVVMRGSPKPMNTNRFVSFLQSHLLPSVRPKDVLVLDNLSTHRHPSIRRIAR